MKLPLWRRRQEAELDEEIAAHFRMAVAERIERGESREEAERAARVEFGNVGVVKETTRDAWGWTPIEGLVQDLRYASRTLRKAPGFAAVAVVTLALGIGANTAMFSIINAVLLRPLPFPGADRLVAITETDMRPGPERSTVTSASWPDFFDWRSRTRTFEHMSAYRGAAFTVVGQGLPRLVGGAVVSAEFFATVGVEPAIGRSFRQDDERAAADVVVMSDALWRSELGGAADVIGRTLRIDGRSFAVIGVMPPGFRFPIAFPGPQLWVTVAEDARVDLADDTPMTAQRGAHFVRVVGRLRPNTTLAAAQSELDAIAASLARNYPDTNAHLGVRMAPVLETLVGRSRRPLLLLLSAVACVLLIACANVANLLLARGSARKRELSLRVALGASRLRIIRQLLTESLVLSLVGSAIGLALAYWSVPLLVRLAP
ncbi:MAG: ABC transporter permease, partial [Vicinamibacterales bacterium]